MAGSHLFRFGMIVAISLLATIGRLALERLFGLSASTLMAGPVVAINAVLVWRTKAGVNG
jgi:hypothetical protein